MCVAKLTLSVEQQRQFLSELLACERLRVVALLVALCFGELVDHHLRDASIPLGRHQLRRTRKTLLDLPGFAFRVFLGFSFLRAAGPVESAMLAKVVDDPRPLFSAEPAIQPLHA